MKFWMVVGRSTPTVRHKTRAAANAEAERLARLQPSEEFVVLESVATVEHSDMAWRLHTPPLDEIPY